MKKRFKFNPFSKSRTKKEQFYTHWSVISTDYDTLLQLRTPCLPGARNLGTERQVSTWQKTLTELTLTNNENCYMNYSRCLCCYGTAEHSSASWQLPFFSPQSHTWLKYANIFNIHRRKHRAWRTQQHIMLSCFLCCCIPLLPFVSWSA